MLTLCCRNPCLRFCLCSYRACNWKILSGIVAVIYSFYYYFPGELGGEGLSTRTWMRTLQKAIGCVIPDSADYEPLTEYFVFHMTKE